MNDRTNGAEGNLAALPSDAAQAPFVITEAAAAEWAARQDVEHVLKDFSTQRNAIEDARSLHLIDAAPVAPQAAGDAAQAPTAWMRFRSDGGFEGPIMDSDSRMCDTRRTCGAWTPLYAALVAPQAAGDAAQASEGWKLVPVEPTEEMIRSGWGSDTSPQQSNANRVYRAMVAAAPVAPAAPAMFYNGETKRDPELRERVSPPLVAAAQPDERAALFSQIADALYQQASADERTAFEAWAITQDVNLTRGMTRERDYSYMEADYAWRIWRGIWAVQQARATAPQATVKGDELRLDKPAQVGNVCFYAGVEWSTVIGAAQRQHEYMRTPAKEAERIASAQSVNEVIQRAAVPQAGATLTDEQREAIMDQAQVFASAWSLVGGVFDSGDALETAEQEKANLHALLSKLSKETVDNPVQRMSDVSRAEGNRAPIDGDHTQR